MKEPTTTDDADKPKIIEGKKGIVRKGTSGGALKRQQSTEDSVTANNGKKDDKTNMIVKKGASTNPSNKIVKKK